MSDTELRELDALIAEHVMGWHRMNFDNGHPSSKRNQLVDRKFRADWCRKHGWIEGWELLETFPHYSTDPAAAMTVLEKCAKKSLVRIGAGKECWYIDNRENESEIQTERTIEIEADTLPLAICLFAKQLFTCPTA